MNWTKLHNPIPMNPLNLNKAPQSNTHESIELVTLKTNVSPSLSNMGVFWCILVFLILNVSEHITIQHIAWSLFFLDFDHLCFFFALDLHLCFVFSLIPKQKFLIFYSLCPTLEFSFEFGTSFNKCKKKDGKKNSGMWVLLLYISFIITCEQKKVSGIWSVLVPFMEYSNWDF